MRTKQSVYNEDDLLGIVDKLRSATYPKAAGALSIGY